MVKQVKNNILIGVANPFDAPKAIQMQKQTELKILPTFSFEKCRSENAKNLNLGVRLKVLIRSQPYLE